MEAALLSFVPKSLERILRSNWVAREAVVFSFTVAASFVTISGSFWTGWLLISKVPFVGKIV